MIYALIALAILVSICAIFSFGFVVGLAAYPRHGKRLMETDDDTTRRYT